MVFSCMKFFLFICLNFAPVVSCRLIAFTLLLFFFFSLFEELRVRQPELRRSFFPSSPLVGRCVGKTDSHVEDSGQCSVSLFLSNFKGFAFSPPRDPGDRFLAWEDLPRPVQNFLFFCGLPFSPCWYTPQKAWDSPLVLLFQLRVPGTHGSGSFLFFSPLSIFLFCRQSSLSQSRNPGRIITMGKRLLPPSRTCGSFSSIEKGKPLSVTSFFACLYDSTSSSPPA